MEENFNKLVLINLEDVNRRLTEQDKLNNYFLNKVGKARRVIKNKRLYSCVLFGILGYSIYVQATKIERLAKEIEDLKKEKGE